HISASLRRDNGYIEASIRDSGVGISPEFLPFIFEPFRQADARFDRERGGLGLGLAISRQLVELHGGTIKAPSPGVGHGATFTIRLPCVAGEQTTSAGENAPPQLQRVSTEQPPASSILSG